MQSGKTNATNKYKCPNAEKGYKSETIFFNERRVGIAIGQLTRPNNPCLDDSQVRSHGDVQGYDQTYIRQKYSVVFTNLRIDVSISTVTQLVNVSVAAQLV